MYPNQDSMPISQIRKGLLVNRETHSQPQQRKITQNLLDALKMLGERHERIGKDVVQGWLMQHLYMQQIEFGVLKQSRQSEETRLKQRLTATDSGSTRKSYTKSESTGTTSSLLTFF